MKNVDYSKISSKYEFDPLREKKIEKTLIKTLKQNYSQKSPFGVIDIGCGSGNWLEVNYNNLSKYENIKWFGVDNSEKMLLLANNKNINISWIQASADTLPLPADYFNFAITEYTYPHFENKKASFKEIYRIINK